MAIRDLDTLLRSMAPVLHPGRFAFATLGAGQRIDPERIVASMREPEGISLILSEESAKAHGLPIHFLAAWISLTVPSDLEAVGLTAAVATALTRAGISCNVVAGTHHDHLFVPHAQGETALTTLQALQRTGLDEDLA